MTVIEAAVDRRMDETHDHQTVKKESATEAFREPEHGQEQWIMPASARETGELLVSIMPESDTECRLQPSAWYDTRALSEEVSRLKALIVELERENEAILTCFSHQELRVLDGYLISVCPGTTVPFVASCPKLRSGAQGETIEQTLADLKETMAFFLEYLHESGQPIPPKDVEDH